MNMCNEFPLDYIWKVDKRAHNKSNREVKSSSFISH